MLNFPSVQDGAAERSVVPARARRRNGDDYLLRGHSLDGSKIGRTGSNEAPGGGAAAAAPTTRSPGAFHINARLDRLAMRDGVSIAPFNLDLAAIGNRPSAR